MGLGMELAELYQQKRKRIEVPEEWHEKGVTEIWCTPINGLDVDVLQKKHKDFISNPSLGAFGARAPPTPPSHQHSSPAAAISSDE